MRAILNELTFGIKKYEIFVCRKRYANENPNVGNAPNRWSDKFSEERKAATIGILKIIITDEPNANLLKSMSFGILSVSSILLLLWFIFKLHIYLICWNLIQFVIATNQINWINKKKENFILFFIKQKNKSWKLVTQ